MPARGLVLLLPLLACAAAVADRSDAGPKDKRPAAITAPKEGAVVSVSEEVEGRLLVKDGWPVVLVRRATEEDTRWWVQRAVEEVADGRFTCGAVFGDKATPPGSKFAAVVAVAPGREEARKFRAGDVLEALPEGLPCSAPVTVYRDARPAEPDTGPRLLKFGGQTWRVKRGRRLGPGPNDWSDAEENVWLDDRQHLHLAITRGGGKWHCAEVVGEKSLGYGTYTWVFSGGDLAGLDRQTVLGLFTYETTQRELDFELSRWGDAAKQNAQFVVQPYQLEDSTYRFDTGKAKVLTCSILWEKERVRGRCWAGEDTAAEPLADWTYTGRHIPPPGKERPRANLWLFEGKAPSNAARQEVVLRSFQFSPPERGR